MKLFLFAVLFLGGILASSQVAFAQNASLYFVPSTGTVVPGQTLTVQVMVNTGGAQVNAVGAYFTYPDTLLEGRSIDTTGSVLITFTPEKTVGGGEVRFAAGKLPPPFSGIHKLFSVTFRARSSLGTANLAFTGDSAILTDGDSRNIFSSATSGIGVFQVSQSAAPPPSTPTPSPTPTQPGPTPAPGVDPVPSPPPAGGPAPPPIGAGLLFLANIDAQTSDEGVLVSWDTSLPANAQVRYGETQNTEYHSSVVDAEYRSDHSILLSGVKLSDDYAFQVIGIDEAGV